MNVEFDVKRTVLAAVGLVCGGCLGLRDNIVSVTDVDGSSDHRVFRIGAATQVMLEPVLWKLEDLKVVDFDRPVTEYFKDDLPPEFATVTLRMLHDGESGLPTDLIDAWSFGGWWELLSCAAFGSELYRTFNAREAFVAGLWDVRVRNAVARRRPQFSNVGSALMWMAICDRLGETLDDLCRRYLIEPYGLKDTGFAATSTMRARLTKPCAGSLPWLAFAGSEIRDHRGEGEVKLFAGGLLTSPSDILRVAYVILPHLDRVKGALATGEVCGRAIRYCQAGTLGGRLFLGFEPQDGHVALVIRNDTGFSVSDGFEIMENLINPPENED